MAQNPLYSILRGNNQGAVQNGLWRQIEAFTRQYRGDPRAQIQQMLDSGQVSQEQYNNAVQMANELAKMFRP